MTRADPAAGANATATAISIGQEGRALSASIVDWATLADRALFDLSVGERAWTPCATDLAHATWVVDGVEVARFPQRW